jgi:hypothetical protein
MPTSDRIKPLAQAVAISATPLLVLVLIYSGWLSPGWRAGLLLVFRVFLLLVFVAGMVLSAVVLVRAARRKLAAWRRNAH